MHKNQKKKYISSVANTTGRYIKNCSIILSYQKYQRTNANIRGKSRLRNTSNNYSCQEEILYNVRNAVTRYGETQQTNCNKNYPLQTIRNQRN